MGEIGLKDPAGGTGAGTGDWTVPDPGAFESHLWCEGGEDVLRETAWPAGP